MKAVDPNSTRDYIPLCDRDLPKDQQTVFELKTLTPREDRLIENSIAIRDGQMAINLGDQYALALSMGLVGVRNFTDAKGKDVKIEHESEKIHGFVRPLKESFLAKIPKEIRLEIAREIIDGAGGAITEEEAKNS